MHGVYKGYRLDKIHSKIFMVWQSPCAYRPILEMCAPVSVSLNSDAVASRWMTSLLTYLTFINASPNSCVLFLTVSSSVSL